MFDFGKKRTLDIDLMYRNVADAITEVFVDDKSLNFEKFANTSPFSFATARQDDQLAERFFREKLILLCAFSSILVSRELEDSDIAGTIVNRVRVSLENKKLNQIDFKFESFGDEVQEYIIMRTSKGAKEAGKLVESQFSKNVFDVVFTSNDVDANYLMYKSLSGLEHTMIYFAKSAFRSSKK